jgi:membrane protein
MVQHTIHSLVRILLITVKEFGNNALNIRASALTYTILLSLVPMLAMSTAVVKGLGGGTELRQLVFSYIDTLEETTPLTQIGTPLLGEDPVPQLTEGSETVEDTGPGVTEQFRSAADQVFDYVDNTDFATLGTIGVLGVLLSAILVLSNIENSMNTIWHVASGRSILRKLTDYLTLLILLPISINLGFAANAVLKNDSLLTKLIGFLPGPLVQTAILFLVPLFFISLTLFLMYIIFPNTKVKAGPALIGALFAGTLWFFTQNLYIGLQIGVSKYNAIYGSFATLPLFLVWMFLGWVFILGGAQLAFACQQHRSYQLKAIEYSPLSQLSAAFDILQVIHSCYTAKTALKKKHLPGRCPSYPSALLFSSLEKLLVSSCVVSTQNGRLLPSAPAESMSYQEIVSSILGNTFPETRGGNTAASLFHTIQGNLDKNFSLKE